MSLYAQPMRDAANNHWPFMKMHGLGNDFVVVDARAQPFDVSPDLARAIGDRHTGVGFDQLAIVGTSDGDATLTFYNSDGSTAGACGNATRCIARWLMDETGKDRLTLVSERGALQAQDAGGGLTSINMGLPLLDWRDVPLAEDLDTLSLPIDGAPTATGMGNPHCTFFVDDVEAVDLEAQGQIFETHPLFPDHTNVQFAQVTGPDRIRMRVWERGVGVTRASGSSACATTVAAARRGLTGRKVTVDLDGGTLFMDWRDDGVWKTGETAHVFSGTLTPEFLQALV